MNKKFVYQVGDNKKLYYDARPTKYQGQSKSIPGGGRDIFFIFTTLRTPVPSTQPHIIAVFLGRTSTIHLHLSMNVKT